MALISEQFLDRKRSESVSLGFCLSSLERYISDCFNQVADGGLDCHLLLVCLSLTSIHKNSQKTDDRTPGLSIPHPEQALETNSRKR